VALEDTGEVLAGELAALVGIEELRGAIGLDRLLQGIEAEAGIDRIGHAPGEHLARVPVHDRDHVHKAPRHRNIDHVGRPDLIWTVNNEIPQQVR
jgi:hypothetical protein